MLLEDIQKCEDVFRKEYARIPSFWLVVKEAALRSKMHETCTCWKCLGLEKDPYEEDSQENK